MCETSSFSPQDIGWIHGGGGIVTSPSRAVARGIVFRSVGGIWDEIHQIILGFKQVSTVHSLGVDCTCILDVRFTVECVLEFIFSVHSKLIMLLQIVKRTPKTEIQNVSVIDHLAFFLLAENLKKLLQTIDFSGIS
jgi:hypothetical protein